MSIFFGLLFACRFYCRSALSLSPGRTGGLFPRINAPTVKALREFDFSECFLLILQNKRPLSIAESGRVFYSVLSLIPSSSSWRSSTSAGQPVIGSLAF